MSGVRLTADFEDIGELRRDLEAVAAGLSQQLTEGIKEDFSDLLRVARSLTPVGPGPRASAFESDDALPHIRDTYSMVVQGGTVAMVSSHPGAVVHEFGGTIAPSGHPIKFETQAMARRAAVATLPAIERAVQDRMDRLIERYL